MAFSTRALLFGVAACAAATPALAAPDATCAELRGMAAKTYDFLPSKVSSKKRDEKSEQMDRFWSYAKAHSAEATPCLRQMLSEPRPGSYFPIDGSSLLVELDPSAASKTIAAALWSAGDLRDIDAQTWVQTLAAYGREGADVSKAGRRWLTEKDAHYFLAKHGGYEVKAYEGAVFLFGSMDEAQARPTLIEIARDRKHPGRATAIWLLHFQSTREATEALRGIPLDGLPAGAREGVEDHLEAARAPKEAKKPTGQPPPIFTRAALLDALTKRERDDRAAFDGFATNPRFGESGARVLLASDEAQVRRLRRKLIARCNQHALDDYIALSMLLMGMELTN